MPCPEALRLANSCVPAGAWKLAPSRKQDVGKLLLQG